MDTDGDSNADGGTSWMCPQQYPFFQFHDVMIDVVFVVECRSRRNDQASVEVDSSVGDASWMSQGFHGNDNEKQYGSQSGVAK